MPRVLLALALLFGVQAQAQKLPGDADRYLPTLKGEIARYWPDLQPRAWPPALIEQESNWKLRATLRTSRELGCGLGQFTKALNSDGSVRFDALAETRRLDRSLAGWSWSDCYNAEYQLRGVILKLKANERQCAAWMRGNREVKACNAASYNGGGGSVLKRINTCKATSGCESHLWFGHLERLCPQSQKKAAQYGESFCEINSRYPGRVEARMPKYVGPMERP